jgi:hypothetical protein
MRTELASTAGVDLQGLEVYTLPPEDVTEEVYELLDRAMQYSEGEMNVGWLLRRHAVGMVQLFVGTRDGGLECVMATEFVQYPLRKTLQILAVAGNAKPFRPFFTFIDFWAEENGADAVDAWCRPSMARMLRRVGFKPVRQMVRREIERSVQ